MPTTQDKTTVTNASVSESDENQSRSQSDEGKIPSEKEIENRVRENLRGEYERKTGELRDALEETKQELEELRELAHRSSNQNERLDELEDKKNVLQEQLRMLKTDSKYAAYRALMEEERKRAKEEASQEVYITLARQNLRRIATEEKIKQQDLENEVADIMSGRWLDKDPLERVELALLERQKIKSLAQKEEELKRREAELNAFVEGTGTRPASEKSLETAIKEGDTISQAKLLGL